MTLALIPSTEPEFASQNPSISGDGRYVAFDSAASNLVAGESNGLRDIFVHDRQTGATGKTSLDGAGVQGNGSSYTPSISGDGRFVAFLSVATNFVPGGDYNGIVDVFVHDTGLLVDGFEGGTLDAWSARRP